MARDPLSPTLFDRLLRLRPDWTRTVLARRGAAAVLVALALVLAVRGDDEAESTHVVTAAHDLAPGTVVTDADLTLTALPAAVAPSGAARSPGEVVGHTLSGPARAGEPITDVRLLGSRLAGATAGPTARIVPLRIDDAELAALLRVGDVVDIVTVDSEGGAPKVLATGANVVLAPTADTGRGSASARTAILVALPEEAAVAVAATSMTGMTTVTLH